MRCCLVFELTAPRTHLEREGGETRRRKTEPGEVVGESGRHEGLEGETGGEYGWVDG